jgi:hypothetical protein
MLQQLASWTRYNLQRLSGGDLTGAHEVSDPGQAQGHRYQDDNEQKSCGQECAPGIEELGYRAVAQLHERHQSPGVETE